MEFIFLIVLAIMSPAIISVVGETFVNIRDSKSKLEYKKMVEARQLEEIKQENYLLENKSMLKELEQIRAERKALEEDLNDKRWLIKERKRPQKQLTTKQSALKEKKEG
ncbi:hypothetical protein [Aliicoccus persicus]|uniref:Uncharacterized protein n=1 Tax=Aliicoccus persicus TaxID=930138 RepID=A0A662Z2Y0_9STAP|nr:hypothetical protein [Aliicoccus persicus]SEV99930.1 hypothetical protein SAMN05192557_1141 [Aliicoccus persicus]